MRQGGEKTIIRQRKKYGQANLTVQFWGESLIFENLTSHVSWCTPSSFVFDIAIDEIAAGSRAEADQGFAACTFGEK